MTPKTNFVKLFCLWASFVWRAGYRKWAPHSGILSDQWDEDERGVAEGNEAVLCEAIDGTTAQERYLSYCGPRAVGWLERRSEEFFLREFATEVYLSVLQLLPPIKWSPEHRQFLYSNANRLRLWLSTLILRCEISSKGELTILKNYENSLFLTFHR